MFKPIILAGDWAPRDTDVDFINLSGTLIINLEGPVLNEKEKFKKSQKAGPSIFNTSIPRINGRCILTLANNHIMDYSFEGFRESLRILKKYGNLYVGAGKDIVKASKPLVFLHDGIKIGIISRAETQFGIADDKKAGYAPLSPRLYQEIKELRSKVEILIVSIHAGAEDYAWPSPYMQDYYRSLVDMGVDIVHGQHSHVPQGFENYKGKYIFYGLGNFCVDPRKWSDSDTTWSIVPYIWYEKKKKKLKISINIAECLLNKECIQINISKLKTNKKYLEYIKKCNLPLKNRNLLEGIWQELSIRLYNNHFSIWLGFVNIVERNNKNKIIKKIFDLITRILKKLLNKRSSTTLSSSKNNDLLKYHLFACESHNQAISTALGVMSGELTDKRNEKVLSFIDNT